jgi:hypothetical protein
MTANRLMMPIAAKSNPADADTIVYSVLNRKIAFQTGFSRKDIALQDASGWFGRT